MKEADISYAGPVRMYRTRPNGAITGIVTDPSRIRPVIQVESTDSPSYARVSLEKINGTKSCQFRVTVAGRELWQTMYDGQYRQATIGPLAPGSYSVQGRFQSVAGTSKWSESVPYVVA